MSSIYLAQGQTIRIELLPNGNKNTARKSIQASVENITASNFLVEIAVNDRKIADFIPGNMVNLLIGKNGRLFSGHSHILDLDRDTQAWMQLAPPENMERIEMRRWARVPADLNVRYRLERYNWPFYEANTVDVGGGGLLFISKHIVDEKLTLELGIHLPDERIIESVVEVKRCEGFNTRWGDRFRIGCCFQQIQEGQRDKLIKYVFQKQRDMIKKGLYDQAN